MNPSLTTIKSIFATLGGYMLLAGQTIEPEIGVWVVSLGGSLLWITLGEDFSVTKIILNIILATFIGIFGSQIAFVVYPLIPRLAACFLLSLFGVPIAYYIVRNLRDTSFVEIVISIIDRLVPWKEKK